MVPDTRPRSRLAAEPVRDDPWLSLMLGRPVLQLAPEPAAVEAAQSRAERPLFAYTRLPADAVEETHVLIGAGMLPVEVALTLVRAGGPAEPPADADAGPMRPDEGDAVVEIAGASLRTSRFHMDPRIPDHDAERLKREWARNCVRGERGIEVLVARRDGAVAGFLAVTSGRHDGEPARVIDLVAVAAEAQGLGVGRALVASFVGRHGGEVPWLTVGTQAANSRSLALYAATGFRVARAEHVLHLHLDG